METFDTLLLSRIQFAANISFHILFPTITIALGWVLFFFRLRFAQNGEGALQSKAVGWSRGGLWGVILGIAAVSLATPFVSPRIFDKWFSVPEIFYILPLPAISGALVLWLFWMLRRMPFAEDRLNWLPFAVSTGLFALLSRHGLQFLPLCGARTVDDLRGRRGAGQPVHYPGRGLRRGAGHHRLYGPGLFHLPRQGDRTALRLAHGAAGKGQEEQSRQGRD